MNPHQDLAVQDGAGLGDRFGLKDLTGTAVLDALFGASWRVVDGVFTVPDSSFLAITNPEPIEKWYDIVRKPIHE